MSQAELHLLSTLAPDDVQRVAPPVLGVRLGLRADGTDDVLKQILETVPVPV